MSRSSSRTEWLFGYGSIINRDSRNGTSNTFETYPARIYGFKRKWDQVYHGVGVIKTSENNDTVNGVLSRITSGSIGDFDLRECPYGYVRTEIPFQKCQILSEIIKDKPLLSPKPGDIIYTYLLPRVAVILNQGDIAKLVPKEIVNMDFYKVNKILQSYMDVILSGCLDYDIDFAVEFIKTTFNWHSIYNDRNKALRQDWNCDMDQCQQIDVLLIKYLQQTHGLKLVSLRSNSKL